MGVSAECGDDADIIFGFVATFDKKIKFKRGKHVDMIFRIVSIEDVIKYSPLPEHVCATFIKTNECYIQCSNLLLLILC